MQSIPTDLEPAERDPKKLRNTALILTLVMTIGGILVASAYVKNLKRQSENFVPDHKGFFQKNIKLKIANGEIISLHDFEKKVWLAVQVSSANPESSQDTLRGYEKACQEIEGEKPHLVLFAVDVSPDELSPLDKLEERWPEATIVAANATILHKFIKNEMKVGIYPHETESGWVHDTVGVLVDRHRHIRGHFDFEHYRGHDEKVTAKTGTSPHFADQLDALFLKNLKFLLQEPYEAEKISPKNVGLGRTLGFGIIFIMFFALIRGFQKHRKS